MFKILIYFGRIHTHYCNICWPHSKQLFIINEVSRDRIEYGWGGYLNYGSIGLRTGVTTDGRGWEREKFVSRAAVDDVWPGPISVFICEYPRLIILIIFPISVHP